MMYEPNAFTLDLEQLLSGKPLDAAIGVVEVVVRAARNLQGVKLGGTCDPYVTLSINDRVELAKTRYISDTYVILWCISDISHDAIIYLEQIQRGWKPCTFLSKT